MNDCLLDRLTAYGNSDYYPFHMPGHKRNPEFLDFGEMVKLDITEIDGFDNMHRPEGIIRDAQKRAAALYGADETYFLVNGSSAGLLAAICGSCCRGGRLLVARNCHKSVYHAVEMGGLRPVYVYPAVHETLGIYGSIQPADIEAALAQYTDIQAVVITSPTYEGVVSDILQIADVVHRYGALLIVDEAHGAHFGFDRGFPQTAVRLGADVVIQSVHKTLPSLTQTALLHICGTRADRAQILKYYSYLQTTSPSYLMMASIDHCMGLLSQRAAEYFDIYRQRLKAFLNQCSRLHNICVLTKDRFSKEKAYDFDMSKIVIYLKKVRACGNWLYDLLLNKYHLQMEMVSRDYVLAMTSICDTEEGFRRLYEALAEIDRMDMSGLASYPVYCGSAPGGYTLLDRDCYMPSAEETEHGAGSMDHGILVPPVTLYEASLRRTKAVPYEKCTGCISAEYAYVYPPGIPFLAPGEVMTDQCLDMMKTYMAEGFVIEGVADSTLKTMRVLE